MTEKVLSRRTAIITGGASGIGAACASAFAAAGADIAIIDLDADRRAASIADKVRSFGRTAETVTADVGDEAAVEAAFDRIAEQFGAADILVNSAGVNMAHTPVADMATEAWEKRIRVDLTGCFFTSRRFVRELRVALKSGRIINISSIHEEAVRAGGAAYNAAKGGLRNLTRTMALETASLGITVNDIAPGMILTPMNERAMKNADYRRSLEENIPLKRAGRPEEVAALALFLASPEAEYITGASIVIDGGLSLLLGQGA